MNIPSATATSKIGLSAATSSRVYVDYVKVETQGLVQSPISVSGFPKSVGNVLSYTVTGLQSDSMYNYTVKPEGNSAVVSNAIQVRTGLGDGIELYESAHSTWVKTTDGIIIRNLPTKCTLQVFDIMGKQLQIIQSSATEQKIKLPQRGIYIVKTEQPNKLCTMKISY